MAHIATLGAGGELIHPLAKKYQGMDRYEGELGERVISTIHPRKVNAYG